MGKVWLPRLNFLFFQVLAGSREMRLFGQNEAKYIKVWGFFVISVGDSLCNGGRCLGGRVLRPYSQQSDVKQ